MRSRRDRALARSGFLLWVNHGKVEGAELIELRSACAQLFCRDQDNALVITRAVAERLCTRAVPADSPTLPAG